MRKFIQSRTAKLSYFVFGIVIYLLFLMHFLTRNYPLVGRDYRYFLSHMLDTFIHYQQNGLSIQWFTPSYGGGLPAYPNPQNIQFALNQVLVFFMDPWWANLVSIAIYVVVGYFACYRLGREILKLNWMASVLGALFFISTGFYIQHNLEGHVGYQMFPLIALFAYLVFSQKWNSWQRGLLLGLMIAIFVHTAGFYTLVIMGLTLSMLIPLVYLLNPDWFELKKFIVTGGVAGFTASLLSIGKIYAVARFMIYFPREIQDHYYSNFWESLVALIVQLVSVPIFTIPYRLVWNNPDAIDMLMKNRVAGGNFGIWEKDVSISPVLVLILIFSLRKLPEKIINTIKLRNTKPKPRADQIVAIIALLLGIWAAFDITSARGLIFELIKDFPFFRSLHVNIRFASSFVLPFAILGAFLLDKEFSSLAKRTRFIVFKILYLATLLWLGVYFLIPNLLETRSFSLQGIMIDYQNVRQGEEIYVAEVMDIWDYEVYSNHASSLYPHEPIFGYELENFSTKLVPGSIYLEEYGYFNFNNPTSFVYGPDAPFTRFSVKQEEIMEQFVHYKQPDWDIPKEQITFNAISGVTFIGILGYGVFLVLKNSYIYLARKF